MTYTLTISETLICLAVGLAVGLIYFGGLWWTIKRLHGAQSPAKTLFVSWFVRNMIMCTALFFVMQNDWQRLLVAFGAMMLVKITMTTTMKRRLKQDKAA